MAGVEGLARDPARALGPPQHQRLVQAADDAMLAPQHQRRTGDLLAAGARCPVVVEIDGRRGAVVLAGRMDRVGAAEAALVFGECLGLDVGESLGAPAAERPAQVERRIAADHPLRQRLRLDQEEPVVVPAGEAHVGHVVHVERRHDVDEGDPLDPIGVVEREAMRDTAAAVVAGDEKAPMAEACHQRRHVGGHRPLAVKRMGLVLQRGARLGRIAVAAQVRNDEREVGRQPCGDALPHDVRLRVAVQEKQCRLGPVAAGARKQLDLAGGMRAGFEAIEPCHAQLLPATAGVPFSPAASPALAAAEALAILRAQR